MNAFVQWDNDPGFGLVSLSLIRKATQKCTSCGRTASHRPDCSILTTIAYRGHAYAPSALGAAPQLCLPCGRRKDHSMHKERT